MIRVSSFKKYIFTVTFLFVSGDETSTLKGGRIQNFAQQQQHHQSQPDISSTGTLGRTAGGNSRTSPSTLDDLIHLAGPLTEDAVLKTLQARFYADEFFVSLQPTVEFELAFFL